MMKSIGPEFGEERKILCPVSVVLRQGARFALLRPTAVRDGCTGCGACTRRCPMAIEVARAVASEGSVASTECTLCRECVAGCPRRVLELALGRPAPVADPTSPHAAVPGLPAVPAMAGGPCCPRLISALAHDRHRGGGRR